MSKERAYPVHELMCRQYAQLRVFVQRFLPKIEASWNSWKVKSPHLSQQNWEGSLLDRTNGSVKTHLWWKIFFSTHRMKTSPTFDWIISEQVFMLLFYCEIWSKIVVTRDFRGVTAWRARIVALNFTVDVKLLPPSFEWICPRNSLETTGGKLFDTHGKVCFGLLDDCFEIFG